VSAAAVTMCSLAAIRSSGSWSRYGLHGCGELAGEHQYGQADQQLLVGKHRPEVSHLGIRQTRVNISYAGHGGRSEIHQCSHSLMITRRPPHVTPPRRRSISKSLLGNPVRPVGAPAAWLAGRGWCRAAGGPAAGSLMMITDQ